MSRSEDEILLAIFQEAIRRDSEDMHSWEDLEETIERTRSLLTIAAISRLWRQSALSHPHLWTSIFSVDNTPPEVFRTIIAHSAQHPFQIISRTPFASDNESRMEVWLLALREFHRCDEFYFEYGSPEEGEDSRPIRSFFMTEAPSLRKFLLLDPSLGTDERHQVNLILPENSIPSPVFLSHGPQLLHLHLVNSFFDVGDIAASFTSLTSLSIEDHLRGDYRYYRNSIEHWIAVLRRLPHLERLSLVNSIWPPKYIAKDVHPCCKTSFRANLHNLKYIRIEGNLLVACVVLQHISPASDCALHLRLWDEPLPTILTDEPPTELTRSWIRNGCLSLFRFQRSRVQWDFIIGRRSVRIHASDGVSSSVVSIESGGKSLLQGLLANFLADLLCEPGPMPSVCKLSISFSTDRPDPCLLRPFAEHIHVLNEVKQLYLDDVAIRTLVFEALLPNSVSSGESRSIPPVVVLPNLCRLFINLSAAKSRTTWGILRSYLTWRRDHGHPIPDLYIITYGKGIDGVSYSTILELSFAMGLSHIFIPNLCGAWVEQEEMERGVQRWYEEKVSRLYVSQYC